MFLDKTSRFLSGRDLFEFDRSLFVDDENADDEQYIVQSDNEEDDTNSSTSKPPVKPEPTPEPEAEQADDTAKSDASPHEVSSLVTCLFLWRLVYFAA